MVGVTLRDCRLLPIHAVDIHQEHLVTIREAIAEAKERLSKEGLAVHDSFSLQVKLKFDLLCLFVMNRKERVIIG